MVSHHPNAARSEAGYEELPQAFGPEFFLLRAGEELAEMMPSREVSLARTKVDEASMWLERARRNQAAIVPKALTADDV